jgi:hypothetical protein
MKGGAATGPASQLSLGAALAAAVAVTPPLVTSVGHAGRTATVHQASLWSPKTPLDSHPKKGLYLMHQALTRRGNTIRLSLAALVIMVSIAAIMPSIASAENPLYCNGTYGLNGGCGEGPRGHIHVNESKNENGGCIDDAFWTINYGYIGPIEECGGRVDIFELTHKEESFPRCWNRTNANDLIHCRYNTW